MCTAGRTYTAQNYPHKFLLFLLKKKNPFATLFSVLKKKNIFLHKSSKKNNFFFFFVFVICPRVVQISGLKLLHGRRVINGKFQFFFAVVIFIVINISLCCFVYQIKIHHFCCITNFALCRYNIFVHAILFLQTFNFTGNYLKKCLKFKFWFFFNVIFELSFYIYNIYSGGQ